MPIRINLLAEAHAAEELRRKDPVKRATWVAVLIVSLVAIWSLTLQSKILLANSRLNMLDVDWRSNEKRYHLVRTDHEALLKLERNFSALQQFETNRFLWGSFLNVLQQSVVEDVTVTRLRVEQSYTTVEGTPNRTNELRVIRGRPATAHERIVITIEARDFSRNSTGHVRLKEALANSALFHGSVQKTNVLLTGLAAPAIDPLSSSSPYVGFTVQCSFPETERSLK